ncbi:MAG: zinc ABC transporter substrate-binding protein [Chloroflexota bacterium]|nr:zinc ABC transporter substrate-binding protein [Chloroflexota bacterium]
MFKNHKYLSLLAALLLAVFVLSACQPAIPDSNADGAGVPTVTVSILPLAYFVERIAGETVNVNVMVGPGENAHTYAPTPEQMKALEGSVIFFSIGVDYEEIWLPRFEEINPDMLIVDSASGIERISMTADHDHDDEADPSAEESPDHDKAGGLDPHVWLSPRNGKIIAENILAALSELLPESVDQFQSNTDALYTEIDDLDAQVRSTLEGAEQRTFMVFHPAWGYFAHDYGLEEIAVQVGGQDPSASEVANLVDTAREHDIKVIFVQAGFSTTDAQAIAQEIGGSVAVVDPLAQDWLDNLKSVAEAFAAALGQ